MKSRTYTIQNSIGLHARPAALFVKQATEFDAKIKVLKDSKEADAKSIISIMALGAKKGTDIMITADGPDDEKAIDALIKLLDSFTD
ncbi:MAG: HPr-like protein Crh [Clostridiales bacterium 38_11]|nr:MAG: HPr-like protein Crh [Clostridiales bacterium 38_11]HBH12784.1 HPr family phosphocarrier protein [Clostridiales bacterium]